jgi:hypothetical protein
LVVAAPVAAGTAVTLALLDDHRLVEAALARLPQRGLAAAALVGWRGLRHLHPRAAKRVPPMPVRRC